MSHPFGDGPERPLGAPVGVPTARADARAKVTGQARYVAEHDAPGLAHGVVVCSTIARGRIVAIDAAAALAVPGVVAVLTHLNRPPMARLGLLHKDVDAPGGTPFRPLFDDQVRSDGQPVALVVAETFEAARHAARLVIVRYAGEPHRSDLIEHRVHAKKPGRLKLGYEAPAAPKGEPESAWNDAPVRIEADYHVDAEYHHPIEPHASTVVWEGDGRLTVFDKTQGAQNTRAYLANALKLKRGNVRVRCPFIGGAFGSGLRPNYQLVLATLAAIRLERPVRVVLTRRQMFTFGHRPETRQTVRLGCAADGRLQALLHDAVAETSTVEDYAENVVSWSALLYPAPNVRLGYKVVELDRYTPCDMRAPGAALGVHAIECAMDELAHAARIDPLELRLVNYAERDETADRPFSSKALRECYRQGAERFGWDRRSGVPRARRDGRAWIGCGMATGVWDAMQMPASARAVLAIDGALHVESATTDIGTGTGTMMRQIAAATLGLPLERVTFALGDSSLPMAPVQGGSATAASVGTAVQAACLKVGKRLLALARKVDGAPLGKAAFDDVEFADGAIRLKADPSVAVGYARAMHAGEVTAVDEKAIALPNVLRQRRTTRATHSAVFAEVRVDADFGTVHVVRVVSAVAAGRIVNPLVAASQIKGAVVGGIGMALHEGAQIDHRSGRVMNHGLADYHVPTNADVGAIDVIFVDEHDAEVNPLGVKGVGEIGIVGVSAAIANAVFNAAGARVRSLPMTPDKVLGAMPG